MTMYIGQSLRCGVEYCVLFFSILLGSPLAVAKAAATLPGVHTKHETLHNTEH
jgi:hypothetical protein